MNSKEMINYEDINMQYIKGCRHSTIVQYQQQILQRIQKWKDKRMKNDYKLGEMRNGLPSFQTPSSHLQVDWRRIRRLLLQMAKRLLFFSLL